MVSPRITRISHLIRPEDLNHHGTLFAGRMAEWMVEGCFIAASRLLGRPEDIVCVKVHGMHFRRPAQRGDILELRSRVVWVGRTSLTVSAEAFLNEEDDPAVRGMATFVSVDAHGNPYAHGLLLDPAYLEQVKPLAEEARRRVDDRD